MIKTIDFKTASHLWVVAIKGDSVTLSRSGRCVFHSSQIVEEGDDLGQEEERDNGSEVEPDQKPQKRKRKKRSEPSSDIA